MKVIHSSTFFRTISYLSRWSRAIINGAKNHRAVASADNLGSVQTIKPAVSRFRPGN